VSHSVPHAHRITASKVSSGHSLSIDGDSIELRKDLELAQARTFDSALIGSNFVSNFPSSLKHFLRRLSSMMKGYSRSLDRVAFQEIEIALDTAVQPHTPDLKYLFSGDPFSQV
jgi:hypothetical protein